MSHIEERFWAFVQAIAFTFFMLAQSEHDLNSYHNSMTNYTNDGPFRVTYEELKLKMFNSQRCQRFACT